MQDESGSIEGSLKRAKIIFASIFALLVFLSFKIYLLQVTNYKNLSSLGVGQSISPKSSNGIRGTIYSKDGMALAFSNVSYSIYAKPCDITEKGFVAGQLADTLGIEDSEILKKLNKTYLTEDGTIEPAKFVWVKRKASDEEMNCVKALKLEGVGIIEEYKRSYPHQKVASHLLGFVGIDENGLGGIELKKDDELLIKNSADFTLVDGRRRRISSEKNNNLKSGKDIHLTIDFTLQQIVEEELDTAFEKWEAKSISCIAINPNTGQVLALANSPASDPNEPISISNSRNLAITDPYEPGSIMKAFLASAAIDAKILSPNDRFDCEMGTFKIGGRTITDHKPFGLLTFTDIISKSSDVGAVKIGLNVGSPILYNYLDNFGFGKETGIDLPGESAGRLYNIKRWSYYTLTSVSLGYEILTTPLQLATGFSALVNGGYLMKPYVVDKLVGYNIENEPIIAYQAKPQIVRRCISRDTSLIMREILTQTVEDGTASKVRIPGFKFGGKTGTAVKLDPQTKRYAKGKYASSFISFAPKDDPKICIVVVVQEPRGAYYGGEVAAPIVGNIINRILPNLLETKQANLK